MAINGFRADGEVYRYNASALEGDVAIPDGSVTLDSLASGVIDDTLAVDGAAADAKATGDAITTLNDRYTQLSTYTSGNGTIANSSITAAERRGYKRYGNIVILDLAFTVGTAITDYQAVLFSGFPASRGGNQRFRLSPATTSGVPLVLAITTSGQIINQWSSGGIAATVYQGQAVYICTD